ncbi:MAG: hypothetical protein ACI89L_002757 [Phycisphaerales bacterium]|jgi:hypothetical protein
METLVEKPCFYCAESCADQPRVKDKQGRYAHKSCQRAFSKPEESKRSRRKAAHPETHEPQAPEEAPDFLADLPDLIPSIYHTVAPCPTCNQRVHPRAVLCTHCGTDLTQHLAPYTAAFVEAKPFTLSQTEPNRPTKAHPLARPLGLVCGSILGGGLWAVLAPTLGVSVDPPTAVLAATVAAALLALGSIASKINEPRS